MNTYAYLGYVYDHFGSFSPSGYFTHSSIYGSIDIQNEGTPNGQYEPGGIYTSQINFKYSGSTTISVGNYISLQILVPPSIGARQMHFIITSVKRTNVDSDIYEIEGKDITTLFDYNIYSVLVANHLDTASLGTIWQSVLLNLFAHYYPTMEIEQLYQFFELISDTGYPNANNVWWKDNTEITVRDVLIYIAGIYGGSVVAEVNNGGPYIRMIYPTVGVVNPLSPTAKEHVFTTSDVKKYNIEQYTVSAIDNVWLNKESGGVRYPALGGSECMYIEGIPFYENLDATETVKLNTLLSDTLNKVSVITYKPITLDLYLDYSIKLFDGFQITIGDTIYSGTVTSITHSSTGTIIQCEGQEHREEQVISLTSVNRQLNSITTDEGVAKSLYASSTTYTNTSWTYSNVSVTIPANSFFCINAQSVYSAVNPVTVGITTEGTGSNFLSVGQRYTDGMARAQCCYSGITTQSTTLYAYGKASSSGNLYYSINGFYIPIKQGV